jgi:hypothetical protein
MFKTAVYRTGRVFYFPIAPSLMAKVEILLSSPPKY